MSQDEAIRREVAELQRRLDALRRQVVDQLASAEMPVGDFQVVVCRAGDDLVALPLAQVERVVPMAALAVLPEAPPWVLGVLNLGGGSVVVVDLLARFRRQERPPDVDDLIVVCRQRGRRVGFVVQEVRDVRSASARELSEVVRDLPQAAYLVGMLHRDTDAILLLSIERLISALDVPEPEGA